MRPHGQQQVTDGPFTAVVCNGNGCGRQHGELVLRGLRESIRRCRHGVLVSAGCLLGPLGCHALRHSGRPKGAMLVVQPCSVQREPTGAPLWVGPLATADDVATVCRWLEAGDLHVRGLPAHLRFRAIVARRGCAN